MAQWEEIRHQVAISGRVTDAQTSRAIGRAQVSITDGSLAFNEWLANYARQYGDRWETMMERPDQIRTDIDGHFHFMDLPDGQYTLRASLPGSGTRYGIAQNVVTVSRDAEGNITMAVADISLLPTTLKGRIAKQNNEPVVMAEVRVRGSGERTFSDGQGHYLLTGLEASKKGERTLVVSAQGCQKVTKNVLLDQAGVEKTLDFVLVPSAP
jgi:hypothetical protein